MGKSAEVSWEPLSIGDRRYRIGLARNWWVADLWTPAGFVDTGLAGATRADLEALLSRTDAA